MAGPPHRTAEPAVASFWESALGWRQTWSDDDQVCLEPPEGSPEDGIIPDLVFLRVPEAKVAKNRLHFDIRASGSWTDPIGTRRSRVDAEANRLAGLGATITGALSEDGLDHYAVGMKDPEGNEFDIN
jgi:hypothetical protein